MKIRKIAAATVLLFVSGCAKHTISYTVEPFYLFEEQMKTAGYTKRTTITYLPVEDVSFSTVAELKEAVQPAEMKIETACDFKAWTCEEYSYSESAEERAGVKAYTYNHKDDNTRVSRVSADTYTEYLYDDGHIVSATVYSGKKKTADAPVLTKYEMQYDNNGHGTMYMITDNTAASEKVTNLTVEYDDSGKIHRVYTLLEGVKVSYTEFSYNEKGMMKCRTRYHITPDGDYIYAYYEYIYQ